MQKRSSQVEKKSSNNNKRSVKKEKEIDLHAFACSSSKLAGVDVTGMFVLRKMWRGFKIGQKNRDFR
jgi:hypothetical protein